MNLIKELIKKIKIKRELTSSLGRREELSLQI